MTSTSVILCQWHSTILTTNDCTNVILVVCIVSKQLNAMLMLDLHVYDCLCAIILFSSIVLRMSLLFFCFEIEGSHPSEEAA